ncbi:MAG: hypothetical protein E6K53_12395 [Gammaproteobacteria bacterium]|nr:MAG: hypothetical protein E6K53_12395 [Gammaproteobacteria bacterium]
MHFELPKIPLASLKDFLKHYLMIVLSILTALGLEAWIEHSHHAHAAVAAVAAMQAELRLNLKDTDEVLEKDEATLSGIDKLDAALTADFANQADAATINQHIRDLHDEFKLNLNSPGLPSNAWEVAVANQSATWITDEELKKLSAAYAAQRDMNVWAAQSMSLAINVPEFVNFMTELQLGRPVEPHTFHLCVRQVKAALTNLISNLKPVRERLAQAVGSPARASQ